MRSFSTCVMAAVTVLIAAQNSWALTCDRQSKINRRDGVVLVNAKDVQGSTLQWGEALGQEDRDFANACIKGASAKKCTLGPPGSAQEVTPPTLCRIYLKDGSGATCDTYVTGCTPAFRPPPGFDPAASCPPDSVLVGVTCVDKYENSIWEILPAETELIENVRAGTATFGDITAGAVQQVGTGPGNYGCTPGACSLYAVSVPGVIPSTYINWFVAQLMCANVGKRLLTNAEWQLAVDGTPDLGTDDDSTTCVLDGPSAEQTGSRSGCVSNWGAFDMVGNVEEWVADWTQGSMNHPGFSGGSIS